ncbi:MAG: cytidylate kinase-like family protein, partial [Bacteroidales bacterium]|nr:cytidylate kinase-like family protein [Bacteroidales bacterium]
MDNVFLKYMDDRFTAKEISKTDNLITPSEIHGPIVTISREAGCSGNEIANELCLAFSKINKEDNSKNDWQWINKQILHSTAKELKMPESKIKYIFKAEKRGVMDDVVSSLTSKYYKSHKTIQKTVVKIIKNYAAKGNIIIVGRGGVIFTHEVPNSLHIKLEAPLEWRVEQISKKHNISSDEARKYILDIDDKRKKLLELLSEKKYSSDIFDIIINCSKFSKEELTNVI